MTRLSTLNETHDPTLESWVESANAAGTRFPDPEPAVRRVPPRKAAEQAFRGGVAIGDQILDLAAAHAGRRVLRRRGGRRGASCAGPTLNALHGAGARRRGRRCGSRCRARCAKASRDADRASCGRMPRAAGATPSTRCRRRSATTPTSTPRSTTRPTSASCSAPTTRCCPNYKWVPIGYHGRASSIGVSGQSFPPAAGPEMPPGAERAGVRAEQAPRLRARARRFRRRPGNALGDADPDRAKPSRTSSACACSTTGRRATSRPGSTSRSGRSSRRASPPPFRRGS